MSEIKSNGSIAQGHATALAQASQNLAAIRGAEKDSQTNVAGNENAHSAIDLALKTSQDFSQAMQNLSSNLHSVKAEFEALDQEQARQIKGQD